MQITQNGCKINISGGSSVCINGHVIDMSDKGDLVIGDNVTYCGKTLDIDVSREVTINIVGNVDKISLVEGVVNCQAADTIKVTNGDVTVRGDVAGNVTTTNGDIEAEVIIGDVKTVNGDISKGFRQ